MYKLKLTVRKEVGEKREKDESAKDGEEVKKKSCMINAVFLDASSCFSQTHNWS